LVGTQNLNENQQCKACVRDIHDRFSSSIIERFEPAVFLLALDRGNTNASANTCSNANHIYGNGYEGVTNDYHNFLRMINFYFEVFYLQ